MGCDKRDRHAHRQQAPPGKRPTLSRHPHHPPLTTYQVSPSAPHDGTSAPYRPAEVESLCPQGMPIEATDVDEGGKRE